MSKAIARPVRDRPLTISADSACAALPDDVRTRTYAATVTAGSIFWIGVFGDYLAISTAGEGPSIVEQIGPNRYVAFWGEAGVSVGPGTSTISAPFKGVIDTAN